MGFVYNFWFRDKPYWFEATGNKTIKHKVHFYLASHFLKFLSIDATDSTCIGRFINHSRKHANLKAQTWKDKPGICFRAIKVSVL
jgi:hypothetical protein